MNFKSRSSKLLILYQMHFYHMIYTCIRIKMNVQVGQVRQVKNKNIPQLRLADIVTYTCILHDIDAAYEGCTKIDAFPSVSHYQASRPIQGIYKFPNRFIRTARNYREASNSCQKQYLENLRLRFVNFRHPSVQLLATIHLSVCTTARLVRRSEAACS